MSPKPPAFNRIIVGAITLLVGGIFYGIGNDAWVYIKSWIQHPAVINPVTISQIISYITIPVSIFLILWGVWTAKKQVDSDLGLTPSLQSQELQNEPKITRRDPKTLDWLDEVKTEVCVLAVDGGSFAESNFERIKKRINIDDVSFTFLLLDPSSDKLPRLEESLLSPKAKSGIDHQLVLFKDIREQLGSKKDNLKIKIYDLPIVHSIFIIDPKTNDGKMTVEYYEYKTEPRDKINIILTKKYNPKLFEQYYNSYKYVLGNSRQYNFEN